MRSPPPRGKPAKRKLDWFWDTVGPDMVVGLMAGAGAGFWFAKAGTVRENEETILVAAAGVAIALLAVALAAMTLIVGLFESTYREIFSRLNLKFRDFVRPFKIVATASGAGAIASIYGAIDSTSGNDAGAVRDLGGIQLRAALFALAVFLVVWGVGGAVQAVWMIIHDQEDAASQ